MTQAGSGDPLPPLREIVAGFGLDARKSLGQHFLLDLNLTRRIAALAGRLDGVQAIEIGPGPGGLTRALLETAAREVVAIERDPRCIGALRSLAAAHPGRLRVIEADALAVDATSLGEAPRAIVANLPYNVGTPLLIGWLRQACSFVSLTLMFQREVAERIAAEPGSEAYGRLAVLAQATCSVAVVMALPPSVFVPPPKVASAVVRLVPLAVQPAAARLAAIERVTAAAFGQRRKMLRQSLRPLGAAEALLEAAGIAGERRAETLSIGEFDRLAAALEGQVEAGARESGPKG